jgi:hypothetical protein
MVLDEVLVQAALNCAGAYLFPVAAMDGPWAQWDDAWAADLRHPASIPPNNATLLRPLEANDVAVVRERLDGLFSRSEGGPYQLWSFWPLPEPPEDAAVFRVPCMVRPPGGSAPPVPEGLEIREVEDSEGLRHVGAILSEAFEVPPADGGFYDERALGRPEFRMWLGFADGRPVCTSCAFVDETFVGIYAVGTVRSARGRGYGEAVTWTATLSRPDLPATLQASEMGEPIYRRMGFETIGRCDIWVLPRPSP